MFLYPKFFWPGGRGERRPVSTETRRYRAGSRLGQLADLCCRYGVWLGEQLELRRHIGRSCRELGLVGSKPVRQPSCSAGSLAGTDQLVLSAI